MPKTLPRTVRALVLLLAALASALGPGCKSSEPEPAWRQGKVIASSERVLWEVTVLALEKSGFPLGSGLEPGKLDAKSGWMISLAPFRGKGFREQAEVRYTPLKDREYKVEVRVRREKNDDLVHPLDVSYAEWEPEADNAERAAIVLQYIKSMLGASFDGSKRGRAG